MSFNVAKRLACALVLSSTLLTIGAEQTFAASACQQINALSRQVTSAAAQCDRAVKQKATLQNICTPCKPGYDISMRLARLVKNNPSCFKANYSQTLAKVNNVSQYVRKTLKGCGFS